MSKRLMVSIYNGKEADKLTKEELLEAIVEEARLLFDSEERVLKWSLNHAFREGFLEGEEFAKSYYK